MSCIRIAWRCVDKPLTDYPSGQDKLDLETILRMTALFLKTVKFIHTVGMCHGGEPSVFARQDNRTYSMLDIGGRNVTFSCMKLLETTEEPLFGVLGSLKLSCCPKLTYGVRVVWYVNIFFLQLQFPSAYRSINDRITRFYSRHLHSGISARTRF